VEDVRVLLQEALAAEGVTLDNDHYWLRLFLDATADADPCPPSNPSMHGPEPWPELEPELEPGETASV
jgi:hypothetical protein